MALFRDNHQGRIQVLLTGVADTNRPPNKTLSLNCPTADNLSARQRRSTNHTCILTPDLWPIHENAESARFKKPVAVQKIFVESGRHFQNSKF